MEPSRARSGSPVRLPASVVKTPSSTALNNVFDAQNASPVCRIWSGLTDASLGGRLMHVVVLPR